jgi:uncharacterized membrane protein YvbJ
MPSSSGKNKGIAEQANTAVNDHINNLNKHRIFYKVLLFISWIFIIVGFCSVVATYCLIDIKDRKNSIDYTAYISWGVLGLAIVIIFLLIYFRNGKETAENLTQLNELLKETELEIKDKEKQRIAAEQKLIDTQEEFEEKTKKQKEAIKTLFGGSI